jgi:signal transduction histidine kinase/methanogenic corrinoid protein MtbC1
MEAITRTDFVSAEQAAAQLVAAMLDGLVLVDEQQKVCFANRAATSLLALNETELLGASLEEALAEISLRAHSPERLQTVLQELPRLEHPQPIELDLTIAAPFSENSQDNIEDHYLRLSFFPVPPSFESSDPATLNWRWGLAIHDTTPDHTADQLKNEFVAVVSHELRTPLSAMQGFSELLLTQDASPERRRAWLEMINRESIRLSSLIDDMLSLSRIESGRIDLRLERVDLEPLIRQCVEILRIGSSKHSFKIEIEENLPACRADRDKVIQILNNIIGNAVKYSTKGGQVVIKAAVNKKNSEEVTVSVTDQGIGIPAEEIPKVFEKFYRVRGNHTREVKGTGLGLAITRKLVELMAGRIWVESTLGQGSTFHFTLPVHVFPQREIRAFKEILLKTLLLPDKDTTEAELYLDYLQRTLPSNQLDEVLRDCLYEIGYRWERGDIGVGDEHVATGIIRDFLSRMRSTSPTSNGLRLVIGGVAGEEHVVGVTMVANAFGRMGWNVTNLGANVPVSAFITTLAQVQPDVLLLSIAMSQRLVEIKRVVHEVREAFPSLIIGIGGRLFHDLPDLAQRLSADFHGSTPDETVRLAYEAVRARQTPKHGSAN